MAVLTIDGVEMLCPSTPTWDKETLARDSGRGLDGSMQRSVVCHKEKLSLTWRSGALSMAEISKLLNAVMKNPFINVTYFSPLANAYVTREMYVGNRSANFYSVIDGKPIIIDQISFNLIER